MSLRDHRCGESPHPNPPPQERERERTALRVSSAYHRDTNPHSTRSVKTPSPACGGGLGWGSLHIGGVYG